MKTGREVWGVFFIPVLLTLSIAIAVWWVWVPIPSSELVFASARSDGAYYKWAQQLAQRLATRGIDVRVLETQGSQDNFERLTASTGRVDVAYLQGGLSGRKLPLASQRAILSLGRVDAEPVWIFSRVPHLQRLDQLEGLRVAIGLPGSGTRVLMGALLEQARVAPEKLKVMELSHDQAAAALAAGELDVMISVLPAETPVIHKALRTPGVSLVNLQGTAALTQQLSFLQIRLLARGVLDPEGPLPAQDTSVMIVPTEMVARSDLPPALQRQLIDVAREVHGTVGPFRREGEMPAGNLLEWPATPQIRAMANDSLPFIERHFSFWQAQFLMRLIYLIAPALMVGLLLGMGWQRYTLLSAQARLTSWYGELRMIEQELSDVRCTSLSAHRHQIRLHSIREHLAKTPVPPSLKERQLKLLEYFDFVRIRIHKLRGR